MPSYQTNLNSQYQGDIISRANSSQKDLSKLINSKEITATNSNYENMQDLLVNMSQPYKQEWFSLKFIDQELERDYQKQQYQTNLKFMIIYLSELTVMMLIFMIFQIYRFVELKGKYPNIRWAGLSIALLFAVASIQCLLSRKIQWASLNIANIQTLTMFIALVESGVQGYATFAQVDLFAVLTGLISTLSFMSYCQKRLFFVYLICMVYLFLRTWFWVNDRMRFYRFNLFFLTSFTFIYIFSRQIVIKEREKFKNKQNQKQMLQMFQNLVTTHHDGIIISEDQDILFYNDQIGNIFETKNQRVSPNQENRQKDIVKSEKQQKVKESLINSKFKNDKNNISTKESENGQFTMIPYENIWEYISTHSRNYFKVSHNVGLLNTQQQEDPNQRVEGAYFTYINNQANEIKKKKLQVFTSYIKSGPKNYVLTTIRDMSFWLEYQKEKNMSSMKTIAFASAAHEFRNPLNAIMSSLELLEQYVQDERAEKFMKTAKISSNLMLYLMNDILDFSQIEAKNFILNIQQIRIQDCLEEIVNILEFKAQTKNIDLSYEVKGQNVPLDIFTDLNRLKQILINLVSNGIKYTLEGYVKIIVKFDKETNLVQFNVKDTGVGISIDQHSKLFSAFTKIMKNRNLNRQGCGLGLQVSKNLANAMGGNIQFKSQVGKGSLFVLLLPYYKTKEELYHSLQMQNGHCQSYLPSKVEEENKFHRKSKDDYQSQLSSINQESIDFECNEETENNFQTTQYLHQNFDQYLQKMPSMKDIQSNYPNFQFDNNSQGQIQLKSTNQSNQKLQNTKRFSNRNEILQVTLNQFQDVENIDLEQQRNSIPSVQINQFSQNSNECQCPKILIVDDEPFNLIALEGLLEQQGITKVEKAFNGKEGYEKYIRIKRNLNGLCKAKNHEQNCLQMVFSDYNMPLMNGHQMVNAIKGDKANHHQTAFILITGDIFSGQLSIQLNEAFDCQITKPISSTKIRELINRYINS